MTPPFWSGEGRERVWYPPVLPKTKPYSPSWEEDYSPDGAGL